MSSKDAYYFSHDASSRNDEKIISLRMNRGWEGYGLYWALIEMLRESKSYELKTEYNRIAFALNSDKEVIQDLIESYDLFVLDIDSFYSSSLKRRMEIKDIKSKKARDSARARWDKTPKDANALEAQCDGNAKESKVKEKKVKEIINYLNKLTGKNFRTAKGLLTRFEDGYTVDDCKRVINTKFAEWNGTEQEKYIRPETLFGTKFDGYLNQDPVKTYKDLEHIESINVYVDRKKRLVYDEAGNVSNEYAFFDNQVGMI